MVVIDDLFLGDPLSILLTRFDMTFVLLPGILGRFVRCKECGWTAMVLQQGCSFAQASHSSEPLTVVGGGGGVKAWW